jgi:ketosteroid isomerase-like protein
VSDSVAILKRLYGRNWAGLEREQAFAAAAELFDPDIEYRLDPENWDRTLHGLDGVRVFVEGVEQDFSELRHEAERFTEIGDSVVVLGMLYGRGRLSGVPLRSPFGHVWTFRDGKAIRLEGYLDHAPALEAVREGEPG